MRFPRLRPGLTVTTLVLSFALAASRPAGAVAPADPMTPGEIALALKKLNVVGSALYVAAHPDDENTAFLSWLSRERLVDTAYLSVTRGDGGQNLIGSETGELMGVIRTQELLAARRIDGAKQYFTRAIDFGYSKNPEEALSIWGKDQVLADVVWVIRSQRPDVIVTRFPVTGEGGHGHHTASAQLAEEAFTAAADPNRFPEQLKWVKPWQAKRLLWNLFRFGADAPRKEIPGGITVDLGAYNALLGKSYTEIAALSRSMHKSQGFGSAERRGTFLNDFQSRLGEPAQKDLFEGVDLTWARVPGGETVAPLLKAAENGFRFEDPAASLPALLNTHAALRGLPDSPWKNVKLAELTEVIRSCAGLWVEAVVADPAATPGSEVKVSTMVLNRSSFPLTLASVEVTGQAAPTKTDLELKRNEPGRKEVVVTLPADSPYTNPYWLTAPPGKGLYAVSDQRLIGLPEAPAPLVARFVLTAPGAGEGFVLTTPVVNRRTDPVKGEVYRPFEIVPPVTARFDEKVYAFGDAKPKKVTVTLMSALAGSTGTLRLKTEGGFSSLPSEAAFAFSAKGEEKTFTFTVTPPAKGTVRAEMTAEMSLGGTAVSRSLVRIDYAHLPPLMLFPPAEARLVRLELAVPRGAVGYVMGPGDEIPNALRQVGYDVTLLSDDDLEAGDLSRYATIITGIRAYNTRQRLKSAQKRLLDWTSRGGTLVVQYNTSGELVTEQLGPHPFKISRDRVTVEEAPVTFMNPAHPLLNVPNRLGPADFDGWIQERGLYFANPWDPKYETPLATHDPGEPDKPGGLLFTHYGKGAYVYTGYAFFRQLPAGVPGAYRLFVNLVSAGFGNRLGAGPGGLP
jgi:LmbE family N-acetylglucosaminyl deacetylase